MVKKPIPGNPPRAKLYREIFTTEKFDPCSRKGAEKIAPSLAGIERRITTVTNKMGKITVDGGEESV